MFHVLQAEIILINDWASTLQPEALKFTKHKKCKRTLEFVLFLQQLD
jgi:hypothetical protein